MIRLLPLLLGIASTSAFAQDSDDPWSQPSESDSDSTDETDTTETDTTETDTTETSTDPAPAGDPWAPPGTEPEAVDPDGAAVDEGAAMDEGEAMDEGAGTDGAGPDEAGTDEGGEPKAKKLKAKKLKAKKLKAEKVKAERLPVDPADLAGANVPTGVRIQAYGAGTGADVGQAFVMGRNGGTNQTTLRARFATGKWGAQLALPFVVHRMPRQPRDTGLGNLQLDVWRQIGDGSKGYTAIGAEFHTNIGAKAYTWVHDADDIWPGTGLDLALQFRRGDDKLSTMWRFAFGVRGGQEYAPWANSYVTIEAAAGLDYALGERFGLVGETSIAYWDLSPWDASALARADLSPGLRLRGGFVFPVGVWTGLSRVDEDFRGFRETTLVMDLSLSL